MLISFTVENYRSFAEPQTLSLVAARDDLHPEHVVDCGNFGLLTAAAVYGANASGKSNLLKAFGFMHWLVTASATRINLGDPISGADPFRLDAQFAGKPCSLEIRLLLDGTEYQYGFSATTQRVHDEWLYVRRPGSKITNPLLRHFDPETGKTSWTLRNALKPAKDVTDKTRDNGLFLSRAAEMNVDFIKDLFLWFRNRARHFDLSTPPTCLMNATARRVAEDPSFRARVQTLVHDADLGIDGIVAERQDLFDAHAFVRAFESFAPEDHAAAADELPLYAVSTRHQTADPDVAVKFSLQIDESNGTQRLFALAGPVLDALDCGHLLLVDELECSMHPLLTHRVVQLFHSPDANVGRGQLVFATHDSSLMTPSLFRRDQIWLTEKNPRGATELFSLSDIGAEKRPRKEEAFERNYLAGRYGAVPSFGPVFEDFEVR